MVIVVRTNVKRLKGRKMKKNPLPEDTRYLNNYLTRYEKFDNSFIKLHLDKVLLMHQPIGNSGRFEPVPGFRSPSLFMMVAMVMTVTDILHVHTCIHIAQ